MKRRARFHRPLGARDLSSDEREAVANAQPDSQEARVRRLMEKKGILHSDGSGRERVLGMEPGVTRCVCARAQGRPHGPHRGTRGRGR